MAAAYNAGSITVLEGLEAVRKRPGMYIGSTGERGLHHLVQEVVDNSVDEALAGYNDRVEITLLADGGVRVRDNGRGIPVDMHPIEKRPAVEVVLTTLHAGGKFDGKSYAVSGGLHGVGISVVNALSNRLDVEIRRDGYTWTQSYDGSAKPAGKAMGPLVKGAPTKEHGSQITFWADPTIFESTEYSFETLSRRIQEMAFLNAGLTMVLRDERRTVLTAHEPSADPSAEPDEDPADDLDEPSTAASGEPVDGISVDGISADGVAGAADIADIADAAASGPTAPSAEAVMVREPVERVYCYPGGIVDFVTHLNSKRSTLHPTVISMHREVEGMSVDIAMQWSEKDYSEHVFTFANVINTHEGGTHEEGFRSALTNTVKSVSREKGWLKPEGKNADKKDEITGEDIREGLTAIISIKLADPQFEGQTKTKLGNNSAKTFVDKAVREALTEWLTYNSKEGKLIADKAQESARARVAARQARDLTRRKGLIGGGGLPGKLRDCQSGNPAECEIFVVEGDSAGGSAAQGREPRFQAILPLRGKILNVEKARIDKILKNAEVQALITALGTGVHDDFDIEKLRYHKIVLMADADVDGQHITTLLLTLLFRFMRPLIEGGYVYLAQPPLYKLMWTRTDPEYAYSDRERDAMRDAGLEGGKKLPKENGIQRFKGLGEMNWSELRDTTMDPNQRLLLRVTLDDAATADELFSTLMGEDVEARRSFIQRNATDVRFLDI